MAKKAKRPGEGPADTAALREALQRTASDRLKTPVTVLGLALQRLETVRDEEERRKLLQTALRSQRDLAGMVEELLRAVRRDAGRI